MIGYTNYTNLDSRYMRPYETGDRLVRGWSGELPTTVGATTPERMQSLAEIIFTIHNRDDRPDGQLCPSMSIGDVVIIGEVAMTVDVCGFEVVHIDLRDLITDRKWTEMVR